MARITSDRRVPATCWSLPASDKQFLAGPIMFHEEGLAPVLAHVCSLESPAVPRSQVRYRGGAQPPGSAVSDVDCMAEAPQGGLVERLIQRWVGVDRAGHVLEQCSCPAPIEWSMQNVSAAWQRAADLSRLNLDYPAASPLPTQSLLVRVADIPGKSVGVRCCSAPAIARSAPWLRRAC
jgi:hypothetical protein